MIRRFQRAFRRVQYLAHVTVFHLLVIAQGKDCTLYVRQLGDSLLQQRLRLIAVEVVVSHQLLGKSPRIRVVGTDHLVLLLTDEVKALVKARTDAKKAKDFAEADRIRARVLELGYIIEDTPKGPKVKKA